MLSITIVRVLVSTLVHLQENDMTETEQLNGKNSPYSFQMCSLSIFFPLDQSLCSSVNI